MSPLARALAVGALLGVASLAYQHDRDQRARIGALTEGVRQLRAQVADAPPAAPAPAPLVVTAPPDVAALDAVASKAATLAHERAARVSAEPPAPTDAQLAARRRADQVLSGAIARGRLGHDDLAAIRAEVAGDPEGAAEVARETAVALNLGKVRPEDPRALLP